MISGGLLIGLSVVLLLIVIFKSHDLIYVFNVVNKYLFILIFFGVVLFFVFSLYSIQSDKNIDLTSFKGIIEVTKIYFLWFKGLVGNVRSVAGNVVSQNWFPKGNSTGGL